MNNYIINTLLNSIAINLGTFYIFQKATKFQDKIAFSKKLLIIAVIITIIISQSILKFHIPTFYRISFVILCNSLLIKFITQKRFSYSMLVAILCISISYIFTLISSSITAFIFLDISYPTINYKGNHILPIIFDSLLNLILIFLFFKIKRFKHGFPFLKKFNDNEYLNIFLLVIGTIIIFMYFICAELLNKPLSNLIIGFIFFAIIMLIILQKTFILYHKQKLQTKALKDYENEINELTQKLSTAIEEKQKLVKSNHEFYHRQEALNKKLDDLIKQSALSINTEFGEDYGYLLDRINNLSDEYISKTKILPILDKTNIPEIDDMLSYMQSECDKNDIEFILKIDCNINYILEHYISKSQLETLLGDLIRNAIIAINHASNNYRSIMLVFGLKNNHYELCIFDSGIPFEIKTLLNLGLKPASTHENEGGTGIGFITTFETINSCNASFIINEITHNNYTKSLEIKFDDKNEYCVITNRCEEINKLNVLNRNIILKK